MVHISTVKNHPENDETGKHTRPNRSFPPEASGKPWGAKERIVNHPFRPGKS
jgi:hypothetical protein